MSDDDNSIDLTNGFAAVGAELVRRTVRPSREFVYWAYFVLFVALGTLGVWVEWIQQNSLLPSHRDWNNVYTSFATFFPALIGSSCVQMMFESNNRRMRAFSLIMCSVAGIAGAILISSTRPAGGISWFFAISMSLLSLWVWWIANADNTGLHDTPPGDAPLGGDPTAPLSGDFGGVKV